MRDTRVIEVSVGETITLDGPVEVEFVQSGQVAGVASAASGGQLNLTGVRGLQFREVFDREPTELEAAREAVKAAEAELEAAQARADEIRRAEYDARQQAAYEKLMSMKDEEFYAEDPSFDERPFVLPFGSDYAQFNPLDDADREGHDFGPTWTAGSVAIICKKDERDRPTRLIWSSGYDVRGGSDAIGQRFLARHDQTGGKLGVYEIVGLAFFGPDGKLCRAVGNVPNRKFPQSTYK